MYVGGEGDFGVGVRGSEVLPEEDSRAVGDSLQLWHQSLSWIVDRIACRDPPAGVDYDRYSVPRNDPTPELTETLILRRYGDQCCHVLHLLENSHDEGKSRWQRNKRRNS